MLTSASAVDPPAFQPGQMWSVKDSSIKIVIGHIEPYAGGRTAISVSVFDVPCPPAMGCTTTVVAHAPFDSEALAKSVDRLIASKAQTAPGFESGYQDWKQAQGGVFTIPVSQLPALLFKIVPPR
jgi:hypothetical protein